MPNAVKVELSRRNFYQFQKYASPAEYNWNWHHELIGEWLNEFAAGRRKRIIIEAPPRHGKSEGTSRRLPAYIFGKVPSARLIACSHTADLAEEMGRDVRAIMDDSKYREVFPNAGISRSRKGRNRGDLFDVEGGGVYKAAGVGGPITGRGYLYGIIDDPIKNREDANSPAHREKVWRWYTSTFRRRQEKNACILITSTRWHDDDLVGRIKKKIAVGESEPFDILTLPGIATDLLSPSDPRKLGEALWPWFYTEAQHEQDRLIEPRDFAALTQQDPRSEGGSEWPASYFETADFWYNVPPVGISLKCIYYDGAGSPTAKIGDWHSATLLTVTADGHLYADQRLWRAPQEQAADILCSLLIEFEPDGAAVESNFGGTILAPLIGYAAAKMKRPDLVGKFSCRPSTLKKEARIRRLGSYFAQGLLHIRENAGGRETMRQAADFPNGDFDDGLDSLDGAVQFAGELLA